MKKYTYKDPGFEIRGIMNFDGTFRRLPESVTEALPHLAEASKRLSGVRLLFRTDSKKIGFKIKLANVFVDRGYAFYQSNVGTVYIGERKTSRFAGILTAEKSYEENEVYGEFSNDGLNDVLVHLPIKPEVLDIEIYLDDAAGVLPPTPFERPLPFVVYGSSIVEDGHCAPQNAYPALLSRRFDIDFYNIGLSGAARGEPELCDLVTSVNHAFFIYDYDHNAPTPEHLRATHYAFFERYREKFPETPVIMMSRPSFDCDDAPQRRQIVRESYDRALASGDKNVYYIDGLTLFGDADRAVCTTDVTHPNAVGHYKMYETIAKTVEKFLR